MYVHVRGIQERRDGETQIRNTEGHGHNINLGAQETMHRIKINKVLLSLTHSHSVYYI